MDSIKFNYHYSGQSNQPSSLDRSLPPKPENYDDSENFEVTNDNFLSLSDSTPATVPAGVINRISNDPSHFSSFLAGRSVDGETNEISSTVILPTTSWARHHYGLLYSASTTTTPATPTSSSFFEQQKNSNFFSQNDFNLNFRPLSASSSTVSTLLFDWLSANETSTTTASASGTQYIIQPYALPSVASPIYSTSPRIMPPSASPTVDLCSDKMLSKIFGENELPWILSYGFVVAALAVVLNIIVITSFVLTPELRRLPQNFYILNLSLSDLLVAVNSLPARITFDMMSCWPHSYTLCRIYQIFNWISFNESAFTMILIAFDRLQMVRLGPFYRTKETHNIVLLKIGASWLIQILIYVPSNFYDWVTGVSISRLALGNCMPEFMQSRELAAAIFIASSIVPPLCLIFVYTCVYFALRKKQTSLKIAPPIDANSGRLSSVAIPAAVNSGRQSSRARTSSTTEMEQFELENAPQRNGTATTTTTNFTSHKSHALSPRTTAKTSNTRNFSTTSSTDSPTTRLLAVPQHRTTTLSAVSYMTTNQHKASTESRSSVITKISHLEQNSSRKESSSSSSNNNINSNTYQRSSKKTSAAAAPHEHIIMLDVASAVVGAAGVQMVAVPSSIQQTASRTGQREMQRLRRAARSMVLLTVIFLCVWMPYGVILCLTLLIQCTSCMTSTATREALKKIFRISLYVMMSDSAINPILYAIAFPAIRQAMIKTFCPRSICKRFGIGTTGLQPQSTRNMNGQNNAQASKPAAAGLRTANGAREARLSDVSRTGVAEAANRV